MLVAFTSAPSPQVPVRRSVDERALDPIRLTVLLFVTINSGGSSKVVQLGGRIRTNRFRALLPIRRTYFPMFVLLPFSTSTKIQNYQTNRVDDSR